MSLCCQSIIYPFLFKMIIRHVGLVHTLVGVRYFFGATIRSASIRLYSLAGVHFRVDWGIRTFQLGRWMGQNLRKGEWFLKFLKIIWWLTWSWTTSWFWVEWLLRAWVYFTNEQFWSGSLCMCIDFDTSQCFLKSRECNIT